jgi:hypothetical protein
VPALELVAVKIHRHLIATAKHQNKKTTLEGGLTY